MPPIGSIIPWVGGYFDSTGQENYSRQLGGSDDVAGVNGYINAWWRVCDGSELNDADSPIFNGATRYLPDLTDSRFLQGSTAIDNASTSIGGNNAMAHTHGVTTNVAVGDHAALTLSNHTDLALSNHSAITLTNNAVTSAAMSANDTVSGNNFTLPNHKHVIGDGNASSGYHRHYNSAGSLVNAVYLTGTVYTGSGSYGEVAFGNDNLYTANDGSGSGCGGSQSIAHTHSVTSNVAVNQNITAHSFSQNITAHSFSQNIDAHGVTNNGVTSDAASNTENRPAFLQCFYIMRVK